MSKVEMLLGAALLLVVVVKLWRSGLVGLCCKPYRLIIKYIRSGEIKMVCWDAKLNIAPTYYHTNLVIVGSGWTLYPRASYRNDNKERAPQDLLDEISSMSQGNTIRLIRALNLRASYLDEFIRSPVWLEYNKDMWTVYPKRRESVHCCQDRPVSLSV